MLLNIHNIIFDQLRNPLLESKNIQLSVARLDKIHPIVSGNKLYKLHYFLEAYKNGSYKMIQTFGGAYSNHLVATAFACREMSIPCKGIIRGERPVNISHTLQQCIDYGMQLEFISRERYAAIANEHVNDPDILNIPEGGYHALGSKGASLIMESIKDKNPTHICLVTGTATTLAGILQKATCSIISIPVLKGFNDINERLQLLNGQTFYPKLEIWDQYHFGGYAKKTPELLAFMNHLYEQFELPTDFVYTAKMMFAVFDAINKNLFAKGSNIICLHTGGLQGNRSLPESTLIF